MLSSVHFPYGAINTVSYSIQYLTLHQTLGIQSLEQRWPQPKQGAIFDLLVCFLSEFGCLVWGLEKLV